MNMDPVLAQIYQLVNPSLPYVIGAYGILWLGLMVYVGVTLSRLGKLEKQLALVEDAFEKRA
jgi:CcmD family protein